MKPCICGHAFRFQSHYTVIVSEFVLSPKIAERRRWPDAYKLRGSVGKKVRSGVGAAAEPRNKCHVGNSGTKCKTLQLGSSDVVHNCGELACQNSHIGSVLQTLTLLSCETRLTYDNPRCVPKSDSADGENRVV